MGRWKPVLGLAILVVGLLLLLILQLDREPQSRGISLSTWFATYVKIYSGELTRPGVQEVRDAVNEIGTNALPWMLRWTVHQRPAWKDTLLEKFETIPKRLQLKWVRYYIGKEREERKVKAAAFGFEILGPTAVPALPALASYLYDTRYRMISPRILKALQEIGKPAVPVFIKIIIDKSSTNRFAAIMALGHFGRDAKIAIPTLLDCLNDSDEDVVKMAAQTLGQLHLEASAVVPALMELIKRSDGRPRLEAMDALYYFGTGAEPALELLEQLRSDPLPETRRKATMLVRTLRPDQSDVDP